MNIPWFKRRGWLHLPGTVPGWIVTLLLVLFLVNTFIVLDRDSHSVSDALYGIFPLLGLRISAI